jgi:hypothetical protein
MESHTRVVYGALCLDAVANIPAGLMELIRSYFLSPHLSGGNRVLQRKANAPQ